MQQIRQNGSSLEDYAKGYSKEGRSMQSLSRQGTSVSWQVRLYSMRLRSSVFVRDAPYERHDAIARESQEEDE